MSKRFSISTKQAVLAGLGLTALATGLVIIIKNSKKKKQLKTKTSPNNKSKGQN
jgi:hypothetical protein